MGRHSLRLQSRKALLGRVLLVGAFGHDGGRRGEHTALQRRLFRLALYLLSTLLEAAPPSLRIATYGAALFCFTDVMYVSYLNSFYMDVAAWLFLSIAAMFYLRWMRWGRRLDALCFVVCCAMAVTSKAQHAILGFWLAPLLLAGGHPLRKNR